MPSTQTTTTRALLSSSAAPAAIFSLKTSADQRHYTVTVDVANGEVATDWEGVAMWTEVRLNQQYPDCTRDVTETSLKSTARLARDEADGRPTCKDKMISIQGSQCKGGELLQLSWGPQVGGHSWVASSSGRRGIKVD